MMTKESKPKSYKEISSYRDYKRIIRNKTAKQLKNEYDLVYFTKHLGSKELGRIYNETKGLAETRYTKKPMEVANIVQNDLVLDVGCGRGEIVFQCAQKLAISYGIDFSPNAISIANNTKLKQHDRIRSNAFFLLSNGENLPFNSSSFDKVFLLDVIEHLSKRELKNTLKEIHRVLKSTGKLIIHSTPNIWTRTIGFFIANILSVLIKGHTLIHPKVKSYQNLKNDPEYKEEKLFLHISEQSPLSLKLILMRFGFSSIVWIDEHNNPWLNRKDFKGRILYFIYKLLNIHLIWGYNLFAIAKKR